MEKQKILVIDDDVDIANLFSMVMGLAGYECDTANSAREALSKLAVSSPDLVLLDMRLDTELGGADILYQIRSNPRLKDTQVIVVTGHPSMAEPINNLADVTLLKPIDIEQLKGIVSKLKSRDHAPKGEYFRDPVTGMYNQDFFYSRLELAIERAKRRPDFIFGVCVFVVSLKQPSDSPFDPGIFDKVLRDASSSLTQNLRPTDILARLSYYKFASLHEELKKPEDMRPIINRIQTILMPPFRINEEKFSLLFHIGKVVSMGDSRTPEDLLSMADHDMEKTLR